MQVLSLIIGAVALLSLAGSAEASIFRKWGVRSTTPQYCFVGDGVTNNPTRVNEIRTLIRQFEQSANIRFNYLGKCPAPSILANGNEDYGDSLRIRVNGSGVNSTADGKIPGKGCTHKDEGSSFAMFPGEADANRSCVFNSQIWDDADPSGRRYTNHPLHEIGHALGLEHEHDRGDADASFSCGDAGFGGTDTAGYLTPYDPASVMNYFFSACGIVGNYGFTGLSTGDVLGLQILYPEAGMPAKYFGNLVVRQNASITLYAGWQHTGGAVGTANSFSWIMDGVNQGEGSAKILVPALGSHSVTLSYRDLLSRSYRSTFTLRVLSDLDFRTKVTAPAITQAALL